ncbi:glycosyltransferase family protein [Cyclobacterium jeungdonense]|uniref:Glycosyltransferase family protein n=1 Tax=Cyclobacterium jeungdonense TaxID=708087 RepID=A0ABT8CDW8_9BACT|nr:glycosyltransferase family protein [Cyclobacterium jeungdonense]MDN3690671.1 glycosyltransferase family protein [Cyclobacterium jeungdonense]
MKFLFIVQGEGRGHMTQAMVIGELLLKQGHEIGAVVLGSSTRRRVPDYFLDAFPCPIHRIQSPNFVTDKANKAIKMGATLWDNLKKLPRYTASIRKLDQVVVAEKPDCVLNFYDMLGGIYAMIYPYRSSFVVIGHQYLIYHTDFTFAQPGGIQKQLFKLNTKITCWNASKIIALSLWKPERMSAVKNFSVWPPMVRKSVRTALPYSGDFFLVYIVNSGYAREIFELAKNFPDITIVAFWDAGEMPQKYQPLANLTFHQIDDRLFIEKLSQCKAYLSTAGFESIAEAMYLRKKTLMVPVEGQYEQQCNALDAQKSGAGLGAKNFDPQLLAQLTDSYSSSADSFEQFTEWQHSLESCFAEWMQEMQDSKTPVAK